MHSTVMHLNERDSGDYAIDLVIPHVDGDAPGFAESHASTLGKPPVPCQLRDNGELRYVLRSVARFAAFFRNVFLVVVDDGHVPDWINRDAVTVVHHADLMPAESLPTFHSAPIWLHLHRIPGLAERFVIAADDEFFGRAMAPADFFDADGVPTTDVYAAPVSPRSARSANLYVVKLNATRRVLFERLEASTLEQRFGHFVFPHMPRGNTVTSWRTLLDAFADHPDLQLTLKRRDRAKGDDARRYVVPDQLYAGWVEHTLRRRPWWQKWPKMIAFQAETVAATLGWGRPPNAIYKMTNDPAYTAREMARLLRQRPALFCINDDAYDTFESRDGVVWEPQWQVNPESLRELHTALEKLFAEASRYELASSD